MGHAVLRALPFSVSRYPFEHVSQLPSKPFCFTQRYQDVKKVLAETFFGPADVGVYSPSVQNTLYLMAKEVLTRFVTLIWSSLVFQPLKICTQFSLMSCTEYTCALQRFPDISSIQLRMPNLHFLPVNLGSKETPLVKVKFPLLYKIYEFCCFLSAY